MACKQCEEQKRPMLIWLVRAGLHTESMRSTIRVELTVCSTLIFLQQDGYIGKVLNGAANHGASTYGNALVDVENEIKKYTDSYIDAPFYTNHDMGRSAGYYNGDNAEEKTKMAQAMNLLMPGNAFLYYGR